MPESPVSLIHIVHYPTVAPVGKQPLLVLLHGVGSNEEDLIGLAPHLDGRFLVVSVRAPLTLDRGSYGWYAIEWTNEGVKHDVEGAIRGQAAAEQVIDELVTRYDADPERVYLMGFSQGAIVSLGIALSHPEKIAGAVIMSGRLLPTAALGAAGPDLLAGLPVLVVHGTLDNVLPIEWGRRIDEYLKGTPVALTYREFPMAHTISEDSLTFVASWLSERLASPVRG